MEKIIDALSYSSKLLASVFTSWHTKAITGGLFAVVSFLFDVLQREALIALLILIVIDFFSALLAAYKCGDEIRSSKIFNTALKIVVYFTLVSAGFLAEKSVPIGIIDEILLGFLVVTELISILENANRAGYSTPTGLLNTLKYYKSKK